MQNKNSLSNLLQRLEKHTQHDSEKKMLVYVFINSRLEYCSSLLAGCPNTSLTSLQLIQNAAATVVTGTDRQDHITSTGSSSLVASYIKNTF